MICEGEGVVSLELEEEPTLRKPSDNLLFHFFILLSLLRLLALSEGEWEAEEIKKEREGIYYMVNSMSKQKVTVKQIIL